MEQLKTHHRIILGDSRDMTEVRDESVHLVITSPPYWQLKDYGNEEQIGFKFCETIGFDYMGAIIWQKVDGLKSD
jgi:DNA modification methylase